MSNLIQVEVKSVYGKPTIYPVNEPARILAALTGKKTLSFADIEKACALGLEVAEVHRNYLAMEAA